MISKRSENMARVRFGMNIRASIPIWGLILLCFLGGHPAAAADTNTIPAVPSVTIEYFNVPGCEECALVNGQILPELEQRYRGYYILTKLDLGVTTNYLQLVSYQKKLGEVNARVYMILDGR